MFLFNIKYHHIPLILLLFLGPHLLFSQTYAYKNYTVNDGLPSLEVYHVMQDSKGYMWFCTDRGVSRYNGYEFENFDVSDGLPDNTVFKAFEDHKQRIWFFTHNAKVAYFYNDSIYTPAFNDTIQKIKGRSIIATLYVSKYDTLYLGMRYSDGYPFIKINLNNNQVQPCYYPPINRSDLFCTILDQRFCLFGTSSYISSSKIDTHIVFQTIGPPMAKKGKTKNILTTSIFDSKAFQPKCYHLSNYRIIVTFSKILRVIENNECILSTSFKNNVNDVIRVDNDKFWIASSGTGAQLIDLTKTPCIQKTFLEAKKVSFVSPDKEGGLWLTTLDEGVFYIPDTTVVNYLPKTNETNFTLSINLDSNKTIFSTNNGLLYELNKKVLSPLEDLNKQITKEYRVLFPNVFVLQPNNKLWIGYSGGTGCIDLRGKYKLLTYPNSLSWGSRFIAFTDSLHCLLFGRKYIEFCNVTSDKFHLQKIIHLSPTINTVYPINIYSYLLGCQDGLWQYDRDSSFTYLGNTSTHLKHKIISIEKYNDSTFFLGTAGHGLIVKSGSLIFVITKKEKLLNNTCITLHYDNNALWIGSPTGITKIVFNPKNILDYSVSPASFNNGLLSTNINHITSNNQDLIISTTKGINVFNKNIFSVDTIKPFIHTTSVKINNVLFNPHDTFDLKHNQNFITFNYTGLSFKDGGELSYRYQLHGIDPDWQFTKQRTVQYTTLPPGDYTFEVYAIKKNGVESKVPASIYITINPAFWNTWWFRTTTILLLVLLIFYRIKSIRKRAEEKIVINNQLNEMELKSLRNQFSPHFLFNSLNTLLGLAEEKSEKTTNYITALSQFYQYSLATRQNKAISLKKEWEHAQAYINLLDIRYEGQVKFEVHIDPSAWDKLIPVHSLQMLIENTTKHNNVYASNQFIVNIYTENEYLVIKNPIHLKEGKTKSTNFGLTSLSQWYKLLAQKEIIIENTGTCFKISIPLLQTIENNTQLHS